MKKDWQSLVLRNFEAASNEYKQQAQLQKTLAWKLAQHCSIQSIQTGVWLDLGTGTGFLADALESLHPNQCVVRVDNSPGMLAQHHPKRTLKLWDLNLGLPTLVNQPTLIASSFALHWLNDPHNKIKEWFLALAPKGWLAICVPIQGSFPEWEKAALKAKVNFTALSFPSQSSLLGQFHSSQIKYQEVHSMTQTEQSVLSLLKPIIKAGAHASPQKALTVGEFRRLQNEWPRNRQNQTVSLTWSIQLLLIQR